MKRTFRIDKYGTYKTPCPFSAYMYVGDANCIECVWSRKHGKQWIECLCVSQKQYKHENDLNWASYQPWITFVDLKKVSMSRLQQQLTDINNSCAVLSLQAVFELTGYGIAYQQRFFELLGYEIRWNKKHTNGVWHKRA